MRFEHDDTGADFFALTTYRRDGTPVSTPVWMAPAGGRWFVYTASRSGKVKRIARDGRVQVAPSDFHGEATGASWPGQARVLPRAELRRATSTLAAKYGMKFRFFMLVSWLARWRRRGGPSVGLEITPAH